MKTYRNGAMSVLVAMMVAGTAFGSANAATGIDIMLENDGNKVMVSGATGSSSSITMKITAPNWNRRNRSNSHQCSLNCNEFV